MDHIQENNQDKIIDWSPSVMLEVKLKEPDDFLKIKETLSRIGVSSKREDNVLWQSCHILHKQGRYYIIHFKELFILDGRPSNFTENDMFRRNTIAILLSDWGLLTFPNEAPKKEHTTSLKNIKVISFKEKNAWSLRTKYEIGKVKKKS